MECNTTINTLNSYSQLANTAENMKLQYRLFWIAILAIALSLIGLFK